IVNPYTVVTHTKGYLLVYTIMQGNLFRLISILLWNRNRAKNISPLQINNQNIGAKKHRTFD
ncbi:hypothetical protein, partial [Actinobacillus porcinus]|uniref:hypothetical protein n=1 Tax=Actinobacillus porcinus TaxID=51048 RepID=UPI0023568396